MPNPGGNGQVLKRRAEPLLLSLLGDGPDNEEGGSVLPPGKRDASGFWFPARCRTPEELFTPYQRSLQEKQRSVHRQRRHRVAARARAASEAMAVSDQRLPLPPPQPEVSPTK
ncbi:MAG TPA: hypothetical protein VGS03_15195 [Candidatus Polarisedimenticolia bacterium]|nr:hypothetical protein [Candidatus Polarisedimenticolia bacterium]